MLLVDSFAGNRSAAQSGSGLAYLAAPHATPTQDDVTCPIAYEGDVGLAGFGGEKKKKSLQISYPETTTGSQPDHNLDRDARL